MPAIFYLHIQMPPPLGFAVRPVSPPVDPPLVLPLEPPLEPPTLPPPDELLPPYALGTGEELPADASRV